MDHPPADRLRTAIDQTRAGLADRPPGEARYLQRVAENLEAILDRERHLLADAAAATVDELAPFLPVDATGDTTPDATADTGLDPNADADAVRRRIDHALRSGALPPSDVLFAALRRDTLRRLAIAKPDYAHPSDHA